MQTKITDANITLNADGKLVFSDSGANLGIQLGTLAQISPLDADKTAEPVPHRWRRHEPSIFEMSSNVAAMDSVGFGRRHPACIAKHHAECEWFWVLCRKVTSASTTSSDSDTTLVTKDL